MPDILWTPAAGTRTATIVLAHGAGGAMDTPFMNRISDGLSTHGLTVARFEFAYMAARRAGGKKRPPPRAEKLIPEYETAIAAVLSETDGPLLIGGKSMGGRVAAMVAASPELDTRVRGVACLGYPFHAPGKTDNWRLTPLDESRLPILIAQGDRDPFGSFAEVSEQTLPDSVQITWLSDGNHDLQPRGRAEATWAGNMEETAQTVAEFAARLASSD